jgi:uncharacterized integral membrane protein
MADDEEGHISGFGIFFLLFFIFMLFLIGAFICSRFLGVFTSITPTNSIAYTASHTIFSAVFGIFDKSFLFFAIVALLGDGIYAAMHPSQARGIANIFLMFALVYVFIFFNTFTYTLNMALSANTIMPDSYAFFSNHYTLFLLIMLAVFGIIMNFRTKKSREERYEEEYEEYEEGD